MYYLSQILQFEKMADKDERSVLAKTLFDSYIMPDLLIRNQVVHFLCVEGFVMTIVLILIAIFFRGREEC